MLISICKSKIHQARVTECKPDYEGSLQIDINLLKEAGILPYERILVANSSNGNRFETYAIPGKPGSFEFMLNGPAACLGSPGDKITIMSFALLSPAKAKKFKPKIIVLNEKNQIIAKKGSLSGTKNATQKIKRGKI